MPRPCSAVPEQRAAASSQHAAGDAKRAPEAVRDAHGQPAADDHAHAAARQAGAAQARAQHAKAEQRNRRRQNLRASG